MPWPGQFVNKYEGKTFYAKAKPIYIERPPIYKVIKQPVFVKQPVIISKVPEIIKTKEVQVNKKEPTYKFDKNVNIKDFEHGGKKPFIDEEYKKGGEEKGFGGGFGGGYKPKGGEEKGYGSGYIEGEGAKA